MGQLLYRVVMINARMLEFEADEVERGYISFTVKENW